MSIPIFMSHNTRDRAWCERLALEASAVGVTPYLAEHDVRPGANLADKVQAAIRASAAVVVLISDNSVNAPYVQQEVGYALACKKLVIPLVQPGIKGESLAMLVGVEHIPFDFTAPDDGLSGLHAALTRLVERQRRQQQQQRQLQQQRDLDAALLVVACAALIVLAVHARGST